MRRQKRSFTLMELWIAASLFVLLVGSLFFWQRHFALEKKEIKQLFFACNEERMLSMRLKKVLGAISSPLHLQTAGESLTFLFNHGAQKNPLLSHTVLGKLYIDNQALILTIYPHPDTKLEEPSQKIILAKPVKRLSFSFYHPPSVQLVQPDEVGPDKPLFGWQQIWKDEYKRLPLAIQVRVDEKSFIIELSKPAITLR